MTTEALYYIVEFITSATAHTALYLNRNNHKEADQLNKTQILNRIFNNVWVELIRRTSASQLTRWVLGIRDEIPFQCPRCLLLNLYQLSSSILELMIIPTMKEEDMNWYERIKSQNHQLASNLAFPMMDSLLDVQCQHGLWDEQLSQANPNTPLIQ